MWRAEPHIKQEIFVTHSVTPTGAPAEPSQCAEQGPVICPRRRTKDYSINEDGEPESKNVLSVTLPMSYVAATTT